jgi:hypothetical protein
VASFRAKPQQPPRGKRTLEPGQRCLKRLFSITVADLTYLRVRAERAKAAGRPNATVSGQLRVALVEARKLRHDLAGNLHALGLLAQLAGREVITPTETAAEIRSNIEAMRQLVQSDRPGPVSELAAGTK